MELLHYTFTLMVHTIGKSLVEKSSNMFQVLVVLCVVVCCNLTSAFAQEADILIADFEESSFSKWQQEGYAFRKGPANIKYKNTYKIKGFRGKGFASSYMDKSLKHVGSLKSPEFLVERDYINLLLGGSPFVNDAGVKLLVDGKEVLSIAAVKGYNLNETSIPVKKYKGQKAQILIYDKSPGYWGLILVDHIVQSNKKIGYEPLVLPINITEKLLIFPVAKFGTARQMDIKVDDVIIHSISVCLAMKDEDVAWWGYLDMSDMIGKKAIIALEAKVNSNIQKMIQCSAEPRLLQLQHFDKFRPQFHFSQLQGWNNDPNGMVYYDGKYHLFWQCNPLGTSWGNMYWGHASSPDLIEWTEHKRALRSGGGKGLPLNMRHDSMATGACFSGSGNIDHNNSLGLNTAEKKTLLLFNSDMNAGIAIFSSQDGINFKRWMKQYPLGLSGRDAKVVYHKPTQQWIAVSCLDNKQHGKHYPIFTSKDLQSWELKQNFLDMHECPEFLELAIDGDKNNKKWVLMEANGKYFVGDFNGEKFIPDTKEKQTTIISGSCYAGQCFSNTPDGRAVYIAWAGFDTDNTVFNQGFTIPMDLCLKTVDGGKVHLYANPVYEIKKLRRKIEIDTSTIELNKNVKVYALALAGDLYDICLSIEKKGSPKSFSLKIQNMEMTYDFESQRFDDHHVPMKGGKVTLRILVDRPTIEFFMADGYAYKLHERKNLSGSHLNKITFSAEVSGTDKVLINNFKVYPMKSILKKNGE
ncbi:glycoside hydrolase family 32 protein [Lentisphaera araneosa]|nr:glycoside hydrolase family 32 protein [Lentisphaera araneosa]